MKRNTLVNLHLYFSGLSSFILLIFIVSGSLHMFGVKETSTKTSVSQFLVEGSPSQEELQSLFKAKLDELVPSFKYDYIKVKGQKLMTRPTLRTFYSLEYNSSDNTAEFFRVVPHLNMRLMELHKGHGAKVTKKILGTIAILFGLTLVTGMWLGLTAASSRKIILLTSLSALVFVGILFSI